MRGEFEPFQVETAMVGEGRRYRNMEQGGSACAGEQEGGGEAGWLAVWVK